MALNRDFFAPRTDIKRDGVLLCSVRGITPNDIAKIMTDNAADVESVMQLLERDSALSKVDVTQDEQLHLAMLDNTSRLFSLLIGTVPGLLARIIAVAADDDTPDAVAHVKANFTAPVQLEVLTAVAKLTFVDTNGFKAFMGNVLGLVGSVGEMKTSQPRLEQSNQSQNDTAG